MLDPHRQSSIKFFYRPQKNPKNAAYLSAALSPRAVHFSRSKVGFLFELLRHLRPTIGSEGRKFRGRKMPLDKCQPSRWHPYRTDEKREHYIYTIKRKVSEALQEKALIANGPFLPDPTVMHRAKIILFAFPFTAHLQRVSIVMSHETRTRCTMHFLRYPPA